MSHFQLEQNLQSVLKLDTAVTASKSPDRSRSRSNKSFTNASHNASRLLANISTSLATGSNSSGNKQRSNSTSRLTPSKLNGSRSNSPSRNNSSHVRASSASRCTGDRFIPNRSATDMDAAHHALLHAEPSRNSKNNSDQENDEEGSSFTEQQRRKMAAKILMNNSDAQPRILAFRSKVPSAVEDHVNSNKSLFDSATKAKVESSALRQVPTRPEKILDAPDLIDDFYLHLLDWSINNHVAVALCNSTFIWNAADGSITELFTREDSTSDTVTSISWAPEGSHLAVGDTTGNVELWSVGASRLMRTMSGHTDRVPVLGWNEHILASGCRNGEVWLHDVRVANHHVATLSAHTQEVCGMEWSPDRGRLLATGGNDNLVNLWDQRNPSSPTSTFIAHTSAVRAISWCPWQPKTLATGGGTTDRTIKFWNTVSGNMLNSVDTKSQVCSIIWNEEYKELASGHGFSHNQINIWKYPSMAKVSDLRGHTSRVLLLLKSPDGSTIASAAADETIRLWKVWPRQQKTLSDRKSSKQPVSLFTKYSIR